MTSQPSIREIIDWVAYGMTQSDKNGNPEQVQISTDYALSEIRKRIEGLKKHPEMSDASSYALSHELGYEKAIDEVLGLFK